VLVLLFVTSLSLGFFVYGSSYFTSIQGMRGASTQFGTSSGIKPPQIIPMPQSNPTGKTSKGPPGTAPGNKDGHRHKHENGS
jgi:hypothetical protein